jgi:protein phosphatase
VTSFGQIEHACLTDAGVRHEHNQDSWAIKLAGDEEGWRQQGHLFLVADGMGSHPGGEKASELAARIIPSSYQQHTLAARIIRSSYQEHVRQGPAQALRSAFEEANASIHEETREFVEIGTTSTVLLLRSNGAWVGHVGDTRCYRIRGDVIEQLTHDHSKVWEYARLHRLDPDEVEGIPSNVIHRCLGPEPLMHVDIEGPHEVKSGDIYLLCSDGLSGQVTDLELGALASVLTPTEACRFLVDLSNLRGGPDNITVIVVRVVGSTTEGIKVAVRARSQKPVPPWGWWLLLLVGGLLLLLSRAELGIPSWPGLALAIFVLALLCCVTGIVGLTVHNLRLGNKGHGEVDRSPAMAQRHRACKIEPVLLDKLIRALRSLRKRAQEQNCHVDWKLCDEHQVLADNLLASNHLRGAFREYCRAMLPLMRLSL